MRVIPSNQVVMAPMRCAVVPTLGQMCRHRFIDTGQDILASPNVPQHVYVSEPAVLEMLKLFGWPTPQDAEAALSRVRELEREKVALEEAHAELEARFTAIDVLASAGFVARKKPGRPTTERQVA